MAYHALGSKEYLWCWFSLFCFVFVFFFQVAFNPITNNSIKKIISRICCQEQYSLAVEQIDAIAKSSGGDVRHAIMSLQLFCLKPSQICSSSSSALESSKENEEVPPTVVDDRFSFQFGRDESLSLFHALGKFLHNKRHTSNELVLGPFHQCIIC